MNYEETIGYLNNLVQNCPKDINQWDSSIEEFKSNHRNVQIKARDLQFRLKLNTNKIYLIRPLAVLKVSRKRLFFDDESPYQHIIKF